MSMAYQVKYSKLWKSFFLIFLIIFALSLTVNAAGGIEDYVPYAVLLILVLTFILAFINFRNIKYERKLLEEERSELANQRLRMDEDLLMRSLMYINSRKMASSSDSFLRCITAAAAEYSSISARSAVILSIHSS